MKGRRHPDKFREEVLVYAADHTMREARDHFKVAMSSIHKWKKEKALNGSPAPQQRHSRETVMIARQLEKLAIQDLGTRGVHDIAVYAMLLTREILK